MPNTKGNNATKNDHKLPEVDPRNWWLVASNRTNELIEELDNAQVERLYDVLANKTVSKWMDWFHAKRESILQYDLLTRSERKRRLSKKAGRDLILMLQHACVFLEFWRTQVSVEDRDLPPRRPSSLDEHWQRRVIMCGYAAYDKLDKNHHFWPFDCSTGDWPFAPEDD